MPMTKVDIPQEAEKKERPTEVAHDEAGAIITDHVFEPLAEWWTRCKHCRLAEAAHAESSLHKHVAYMGDDDD